MNIFPQASRGSFSAVSKPIFASKYSLESSRRDLHNALLCTVVESNPKNQENHGEKRTWSNPGKNGQEKLISSRSSLLSATSARELKIVYEFETKYLPEISSSTPCERHANIYGGRRQYKGFLFSGFLIHEFPSFRFPGMQNPSVQASWFCPGLLKRPTRER